MGREVGLADITYRPPTTLINANPSPDTNSSMNMSMDTNTNAATSTNASSPPPSSTSPSLRSMLMRRGRKPRHPSYAMTASAQVLA